MSYFRDTHPNVRIKHALNDQPGLRNSQIGALHAVSAHFSLRHDPGLVVLPTGTGKTAVLMLAPYLLLSKRVLVITQSRFVRDQITQDFRTLRTLKAVEALAGDQATPNVFENKERVETSAAWESFREYDVVVATPNAASPAIKGIAAPPADLFDLVLVDEAHHSPAPTWNALIAACPGAKVVLFTATPFRRDQKEIKAKYLYSYPIQRAFEDGIFGEMTYVPVAAAVGQTTDETLAIATEAAYRQDEASGLSHSIMVRADSRPRANELAEVYGRVSTLRLELVDSSKSQRSAEKTVAKLRAGELDGVICVNMLGEGFDLPRLKIAALHAPHRSLGVTLQFFGRFARVNGPALGEAKFLAAPSEMAGEMAELFEESDSWGKKIRLIGEERIGEEVEMREFLESFEDEETKDTDGQVEDISLFSFTVFNHVKVHEVFGTVDLHAPVNVPGFVTERLWVNEDQATIVALLREAVRPQWATTPGLDRVEHHLVVIYWDETAKLLFMCSSHREESLYKAIGASVVSGSFRTLSLNKTNRVLRSFAELELFNVGIRNRATGTVAESYRQISGSSAHQALQKGDAALYHRGHIFGRGQTAEGTSTIGASSLGKIWRLEPTKIPKLVEWCRGLARDIENAAPFKTGIAIDHFDVGTDIAQLPDVPVLAADWDEHVYNSPWVVTFIDQVGHKQRVSLLDLDLIPESKSADPKTITLHLDYEHFRTTLIYTIGPVPGIAYADGTQPRISVVRGFSEKDFVECISEEHLRFHLADGSVLQGAELFPPMGEEELLYDVDTCVEAVDWAAALVDIQIEVGDCKPYQSIHAWLHARLANGAAGIVLYDHRAGECADFLAVGTDVNGRPTIDLYHCKASGEEKPGDRVADAYEVCGQAVKSAKFRNKRRLVKHLKKRVANGSLFVKGTMAELMAAIEPDPRYEISIAVYVVQPGMTRDAMSPKVASLLMSVNRGLVSVGCQPLRVICST